ncbi:MAG: hypothetical protein EB143_07965, partial [Actinobacteria bacterium]|nr:hypothetical protein [Actinomycetota bacterium]
GGTVISAGTLQVSSTGSLNTGNYTGTISNAGTLTYASSADQTLAGVISGAGALNKTTNSSTLTLSGNNSYTGLTTVSAGIAKISHANALGGSGTGTNVSSTGAVHFDGTNLTVPEPFNISGNGSGTGALLNLANTNTVSRTVTLGAAATVGSTAGTLVFDHATALANSFDAAALSAYALSVVGAGNVTIVDPIATVNGTVTKGVAVSDTGTLSLQGANTYAGATSINYGTVEISNDTSLGTAVGATTVASGAMLQVAGNGSLSSAEPLTISGTGVSSAGVLNFTASATLSGTVAMAADSTVQVASSKNGILSGVVSGTSLGLTKTGAGTLTLSGSSTNTYTGATTISAGTLALGAANKIADTSAVSMANSTTFNLANYSETVGSIATSDT